MAHLPPIVSDLAMILLVAGITTIPVSYTHLRAHET